MENPTNSHYTETYYNAIHNWSQKSAEVIVPLLVEQLHPFSVVDVGCGDGTWLSVFSDAGIPSILGLDGPYVLDGGLRIPEQNFIPCDLANPPKLNQHFDLAVCLEVAEHLPPSAADTLVQFLTELSDYVLFSAAIPLQSGESHINCQWQDYWRNKFLNAGFQAITTLRNRIWQEIEIPYFYKQNIALYVNSSVLEHHEGLSKELEQSQAAPFSVIHPEYYLEIMQYLAEAKQERTFGQSLRYHTQRRLRSILKKMGFK